MLFSTPVFLFLFLPLVLAAYYLVGNRLRNGLLLAASLGFYAWGEPIFIWVMLVSIAMNYLLGLGVHYAKGRAIAPWLVGLAVACNLLGLGYFKYCRFFLEAVGSLTGGFAEGASAWSHDVVMPIGISFYTFQAMSYVVDVYRGAGDVQRNPLRLALYVAFFPQLIAGPIVRYCDIAAQLASRQVTRSGFVEGIQRFVFGLAKKMLVANALAVVVDSGFGTSGALLSTASAWLALAAYALQIYFDFSGYSDMAIGLGRMFGFTFLENFNRPYASASVTEFWRRWHISLSTWFRDYLYIPLGGNRCGTLRTYLNLLIVFTLCGLWHGASYNFLAWGLFHGIFLVVERAGGAKLLDRCPRAIGHVYAVVTVLLSWVLFRTETLTEAGLFYATLFGASAAPVGVARVELTLDGGQWIALVAAILLSLPLSSRLPRWADLAPANIARRPMWAALFPPVVATARAAAILALLVATTSAMLAATYNPFIYFRF